MLNTNFFLITYLRTPSTQTTSSIPPFLRKYSFYSFEINLIYYCNLYYNLLGECSIIMLSIFIRYSCLLLCNHHIFTKIHKRNTSTSLIQAIICICIFLYSYTITFKTFLNTTDRILYTFIISFIFYSMITKTFSFFMLSTHIISFGLSYVLLAISCIINSLIFLPLYLFSPSSTHIIVDCFIGLFQIIMAILLLKSNRLYNGLLNIIRNKYIIHLLILCSITILYFLIISSINLTSSIIFENLFIIILCILFLYYWQHRITQTYLERLRIANENSLENEITSLKEEISSLTADNHRLTQIVHKDNKLVPAMETTILEFLQSAKVLSTEELVTLGDELSRTLHEMARERAGILTSLSSTNNSTPSSGLIAIDGLLSYMEKRAAESNINYKVKMDDNIKELILTALNEDNLRHLLGDLIENAIIATNYSELPKHISIHLGSLQDKFLLEISDSGIPFNPETYQHFGYEHCSTHQEDGGTGTGLLDIWSIKKKYKASLYIYEYESSSNVYTKKISFLFDGKNHFLLKTYRDKEIKNSLIRGDLHVFPHEAE